MATPINVLMVEDSMEDTLLLVEELKSAGFDPKWKRVQTEADYCAGLEDSLDLIISDYSMPQFTGLRAVDLLRERGLDIPFILVSGTLGEEKAVEAMKHGVTDYLLKDRIGRLGNAVERALEQKRLRDERGRMQQQLALQATALEIADNGIVITDRAGTILWVNPAFTTVTGYAAQEVIGKTPRVVKSGKHDQKFYHDFWQTIISGKTWRGEFINRRKDGSLYYDEHTVTPVKSNAGKITHFIGIMHDVTERKRAEQTIRENERLLRLVIDLVPHFIFAKDAQSRHLFANRACAEANGLTPEQVVGRSDLDLTADREQAELFMKDDKEVIATGQPKTIPEERLTDCTGRTRILQTTKIPFTAPGTGVPALLGVAVDITERKRAEESLKLFRTLIDRSNDAIEVVDPDTARFLDVNQKGCADLGYSREEFLSLKVFDVDPLVDEATFRQNIGEIRKFGFKTWHGVHRRKDGSSFPVEVNLNYVQLDRDYVVTVVRDITERQRSENVLRESERRFREMLENLELIAMTLDQKGTVTFCNDYLLRLTGWQRDEVIGKDWFTTFIPATDTETKKVFFDTIHVGKVPVHHENLIMTRQGELREIAWNNTMLRDAAGGIIGTASIGEDITERKQAQKRMLRAQRLESIGTLAGGIAHDLNNALTPILMATELLRMEFPNAMETIDTLEGSAKRAADMVRQLLTFAKGVEGARLLVQPLHMFKEMEKIVKATFPKNIQLRTTYAKKLHTILGDATQLHQVLLNLCVNARDAMPNGGTLTLEAENAEIDATYASTVPEAKPGPYVVWRVTDTGTGIAPEVLERIFEPFFSTKGPDKGTGLGLSTVIGIVKSHGGFVRVYSTPGRGSTFSVYLPFAGDTYRDTSFMTKADTTFRGKGETILVVDDEANVRQVARSVLTALNFQVITAGEGTEALIQVAEKRSELRAVITDLHMPHMDGLDFVRVLKHMLPEAGIIVASGRMSEAEANQFKKLGAAALLEKPFTQEQLVEALKAVFQK